MTPSSDVVSQNRYARIAGVMYLVVIATYIAGDVIRSKVEGSGTFVEAAHNIASSEHLYRIGLSFQLVEMLLTIWLAIGLYVTVRPLNRNLAVAALASRMAEIIIGGAWVVLQFGGFYIQRAASHTDGALDVGQLNALSEFIVRTSSAAYNVAGIFFAMGSTIFFYLFVRSKYLPKWLSSFGLFASVLILIVCFSKLIAPEYSHIMDYGWYPMGIAEIVTGIWLLVKGVGTKPAEATA